ncbi:MAG: FAD-dependent oxidoreductase [Gemmobacter sp.]|nr:FAD-dependent oxidoreductase [Gemmobacter sp.]
MDRYEAEIAVIGAGVVGLAIALRLAQEGRSVIVIDPAEPGSGASYGNAGTIADYAVMPVGSPAVLRNLPSLLLNRNSPLAIRQAAIASLAPWLLRFAVQSLPAATLRNADAIARLTADSCAMWEELAVEIGGTALLQRRGALYVYASASAFRAAESDMEFRREKGVTVDLVDAAGVAALEPGLPPRAGGAFFPNAVSMSDPGRMVGLLAEAAFAAGVRHVRAQADGFSRGAAKITVTGPRLQVSVRRVVIAAGAHSRDLARAAGDRVPLDTERGYHLEWDMPVAPVTRPVCPTERGFYLCPMAGRLRVAGTVELGGLTSPPSPHRLKRLEDGARALFPDLPAPDRTWMGFRPSMPDSVPVIGPSRAGPDVYHAYGHGHIGLTLAPVTARIIADMIAGRKPDRDVSAALPSRF